jgi:hypothetical protein
MTDRHSGYVVVLEKDIREDDAEGIINAIKMVKGVLTVKPVEATVGFVIERERVKAEYANKLHDAILSVLSP